MKRSSLNFIVDIVSFVDLVGMVLTGIIMKYILPPGTGGGGREVSGGMGREHIRELWSMSRHEWGSIHYCLALIFIVMMTAHILLHWDWIKNYFKSLFGPAQKKDSAN
jgi:hypothetical protein